MLDFNLGVQSYEWLSEQKTKVKQIIKKQIDYCLSRKQSH